jgi:hypothetical protein
VSVLSLSWTYISSVKNRAEKGLGRGGGGLAKEINNSNAVILRYEYPTYGKIYRFQVKQILNVEEEIDIVKKWPNSCL